MTDTDWETTVKNTLKAELKRRGITYEQLVERLAAIGVEETVAGVKGKLSRGSFSAAYLFQCLNAIGCKELRLD